jgi:hypothetical protein
MRIKAEGDYAAIKALVDRYGVHFDPAVRDQVVARYKQLDLPTYWAGINADESRPHLTRVAPRRISRSATRATPCVSICSTAGCTTPALPVK